MEIGYPKYACLSSSEGHGERSRDPPVQPASGVYGIWKDCKDYTYLKLLLFRHLGNHLALQVQ